MPAAKTLERWRRHPTVRFLALALAVLAVYHGYLYLAGPSRMTEDRKSTRLNSSHSQISYAVFCLKKKKTLHQRGSSSPVCYLPLCAVAALSSPFPLPSMVHRRAAPGSLQFSLGVRPVAALSCAV